MSCYSLPSKIVARQLCPRIPNRQCYGVRRRVQDYLFGGVGLSKFPKLAGLSGRLLISKFKLDDNVGDLLFYCIGLWTL